MAIKDTIREKKEQLLIEPFLYSAYESSKMKGKFPVKIRVTHTRKRKYFPVKHDDLNLFLSPQLFKKINDAPLGGKGLKPEEKRIFSSINKAYTDADTIAASIEPFNLDEFKNKYEGIEPVKNGFIVFGKKHINNLMNDDRVGTAMSYSNGLNSFARFLNEKKRTEDILPHDISVDLLREYQKWMLSNPVVRTNKKLTQEQLDAKRRPSKTTLGIYLRSIRVIYNEMAYRDPTLWSRYPFQEHKRERGKFKIPKGSGHKGQALSLDDFDRFKNYHVVSDPENREYEAKMMWLFSYYANGMNPLDIIKLKYSDIKGDYIEYIREKTKETDSETEILIVYYSDELKEIVQKFGTGKEYIFKYIRPGMDAVEVDKARRAFIQTINKYLTRICKHIDIPLIKMYWARNSWTTHTEIPVEKRQKLLGHKSLNTTQRYVGALTNDAKAAYEQLKNRKA
jgi:integrase/recombinase XerD